MAPTSEIVYNDEVSIIPKPASNVDIKTYHDPWKRKPMWMKVEAPSCSSNSDGEDVAEQDQEQQNVLQYPMGPIKPGKKKSKSNVKGLYACEICGQDYTNKSDLANHTAQHEGVTYTCDKCEKVYHS